MECHILFPGKNKQNILKCYLLKILPRVLSVNAFCCLQQYNKHCTRCDDMRCDTLLFEHLRTAHAQTRLRSCALWSDINVLFCKTVRFKDCLNDIQSLFLACMVQFSCPRTDFIWAAFSEKALSSMRKLSGFTSPRLCSPLTHSVVANDSGSGQRRP